MCECVCVDSRLCSALARRTSSAGANCSDTSCARPAATQHYRTRGRGGRKGGTVPYRLTLSYESETRRLHLMRLVMAVNRNETFNVRHELIHMTLYGLHDDLDPARVRTRLCIHTVERLGGRRAVVGGRSHVERAPRRHQGGLHAAAGRPGDETGVRESPIKGGEGGGECTCIWRGVLGATRRPAVLDGAR